MFKTGYSYVEKESLPVLEKMAKALRERDDIYFTIQGHVCCTRNERDAVDKGTGKRNLSLARASKSLSGGESQRIRLASQIGSGLTGVLYVLDEPSIGLHQKDNQQLISTLFKLRDLGNTVIIVEHDEDAIRQSDHIIDIGVKAGIHGGEVIAQGNLKKILKSSKSLTAQYLNKKKQVAIPEERRKFNKEILKKNSNFKSGKYESCC